MIKRSAYLTGAGHHWFDVYVLRRGRKRLVGTYDRGDRARDEEHRAYRGRLPAAERKRQDYLTALMPRVMRAEERERQRLSAAGRTLAMARWTRKKGAQ